MKITYLLDAIKFFIWLLSVFNKYIKLYICISIRNLLINDEPVFLEGFSSLRISIDSHKKLLPKARDF